MKSPAQNFKEGITRQLVRDFMEGKMGVWETISFLEDVIESNALPQMPPKVILAIAYHLEESHLLPTRDT